MTSFIYSSIRFHVTYQNNHREFASLILDDHGGNLQSVEVLVISEDRFHERLVRIDPRLYSYNDVLIVNEATDFVLVLNHEGDDRQLLRKNILR